MQRPETARAHGSPIRWCLRQTTRHRRTHGPVHTSCTGGARGDHADAARGQEPGRHRKGDGQGPVDHQQGDAQEWIGNGVLDGFLEDESLFGEFLRTPVSEDGVEPLVVEPPHVVVEVMPQLLDRGVVVPVHELLLQQPVHRFDYGVVVGVALA